MTINYFKGIDNLQDLKNLYRELAKKHHPDHGGDNETMKKINAEFEYLFNTLPKTKGEKASEQTATDYIKVVENIIHIPDIKIEIIGTWIWITGNTKPVKEELKKAGFKFAPKKVAWYWHGQKKYRKRSKKKLSMEEIRNLYGSEELEKKERKKIAV
jgi:curved DNA-binding protein CbpA